jgi:hypothetical protein
LSCRFLCKSVKRRRLLGALLGAATVAGCTGSSDDESPAATGEETPTRTGTDTTSTTSTPDPTTGPTETSTPGENPSVRTLSVEGITNLTDEATHALRLNELGGGPHGNPPTPADLTDRQNEVVEAALEDSYETEDPPGWLAEFAGGTPYLRVDGTYYRLRNDFPVYTVTAETTTESEVSGEIAGGEAYEEAVTHDGLVTTGLVRIAHREGMSFTYLWPSLREFLDTYEAVRYRGDLYSLSVETEDPGPPYSVTAEEIEPSGLTDAAVWNASEAPDRLREYVRKAGATGGVYRVDEPPGTLLSKLRSNQYVYLDGTFYTTYVEDRGPVPISLTAEFADPKLDDDGANLALTLHNDHDGPVSITSGAPAPFGVLGYHPEGESGARETLWSDSYAESSHVQTEGHEVKLTHDIALSTEISESESVGETFLVEDADLSPGTYVVEGSVGVSPESGGDGGTFTFRIRFSVE